MTHLFAVWVHKFWGRYEVFCRDAEYCRILHISSRISAPRARELSYSLPNIRGFGPVNIHGNRVFITIMISVLLTFPGTLATNATWGKQRQYLTCYLPTADILDCTKPLTLDILQTRLVNKANHLNLHINKRDTGPKLLPTRCLSATDSTTFASIEKQTAILCPYAMYLTVKHRQLSGRLSSPGAAGPGPDLMIPLGRGLGTGKQNG